MTPRPQRPAKSRPLSAIYIGSTPGSTPPGLPDLPEPPSPGASSNDSGLPSPPATNSTGSGSVGDTSTNAGSIRRQRSASRSNPTAEMSNGSHDKHSTSSKNGTFSDDEDDAYTNDNDEDNTARLSNERRPSFKATPDNNVSALQRVKSLAQRNRMVLDKLSSISRLSSPAPASRNSRSPLTPPVTASSSSSAASSRTPSSQSRPRSASTAPPAVRRLDSALSGSETERESQHISSYSQSSSEGRVTSAHAQSETSVSETARHRRISAPASPDSRARQSLRDKDRGPSPGPSRTPRKRMSMLSAPDTYGDHTSDDENDVTIAALAAVASSRRSPSGSSGKKTRQPLPKEFRDNNERRSLDGRRSGEPTTPHRHPDRNAANHLSLSPHASGSMVPKSTTPASPRRSGASRYSTVRELTRKHQTRWLSEDLTSPSIDAEDDTLSSRVTSTGRRQGHRNGSSDGLLPGSGGRSLVGEGLRAAGLTKRRDPADDVFTSNGPVHATTTRRTKSTGNSSVAAGDWDVPLDHNTGNGEGTRISEGIGPPSGSRHRIEIRTTTTPLQRQTDRGHEPSHMARPGTSMAALHHDSPDQLPGRSTSLRNYRSAHPLTPSERDRNGSPYVHQEQGHDREYSSPYLRSATASVTPGMVRDTNAEHRRLMLESLAMFESQLSRLPPLGQVTTSTIPEVFQTAQHLVHTMDKLNGMLKAGTNRALEAQIDAEVADHEEAVDLADLWRAIGAEHRESLRASDEVVRNMTGFLLGVAKILRESTSLHSQHSRTVSLDDEALTRRLSPDIGLPNGARTNSDGRKSRETRRSWEPPPREVEQVFIRASSRDRTLETRPASSLTKLRSSATSSSEDRGVSVVDHPPPSTRASTSAGIRQIFSPRDQRSNTHGAHMTPINTRDLSNGYHGYEPSPTPASRHPQSAHPDRYPAMPPTLPTVPSESLLSRSHTVATDKASRRKVSSNSQVTVRAESATPFHVIKPSNPTTAVTPHTVSNSPETTHPLLRSESSGSSRYTTNNVTFSRPSTVSVSTLSGLQQQHEGGSRKRFESVSSGVYDESPLAPSATILSPLSGSETERDTRRRTIGVRSGRGPLDGIADAEEYARASISQSSISARKERRKTMMSEIFS